MLMRRLIACLDVRGGRVLAFEGNYTETADRRAERRRRPEPPFPAPGGRAAEEVRPAPSIPAARPGRRVDSPSQKEIARRRKRIASLEEKIAALEAEVEALETRLWEEALTLGPVASRDLTGQKATRKTALDALVEEWAALSEEESRVSAEREA